MTLNSGKTSSVRTALIAAIIIAVVAVLGYVGFKGNVRGQLPRLAVFSGEASVAPTEPVILGKDATLRVAVDAQLTGVCALGAAITQADKTIELYRYAGQKALFPAPSMAMTEHFQVTVAALREKGLQEGPATLAVHASDCALFAKTLDHSQALTLDWTPPRLELLSSEHYLNQGGADVAVYRTSEEAVWSGMRVGPYRFRGYAKPDAPEGSGERFAFFVFSYELPETTSIDVVAIDAAGNEAQATLSPARFFPKEFRHRELVVDDAFIQSKIADVIANTPGLVDQGDALKNFLLVNRDLRQQNAQFLLELAATSTEQFYWRGAFHPLANASVEANFADHRIYLYNGEKVDEQVHLGFDLASYERTPIAAAGAGKVVYAGYFGIYGNTVVIDHGYGLMSLYGHLSAIEAQVGDNVAQDAIIGASGTTGLAVGDHVHFSMLVQGVQTVPIEFWDPHWINDHVYLRLGEAAFPTAP